MEVKERIQKIRSLMKEEGVQAYLVPSTDPHASEYLPEFWKRRRFISGFTGSAGDVVITENRAGLWTDGRYFLQAEEQLEGSGMDLFRMGTPDVPKLINWVKDELQEGQSLGIDPRVLTLELSDSFKKTLSEKGIKIKFIEKNLVDEIWTDQPAPPEFPIRVHPSKLSGATLEEKLKMVREKMAEEDCDAHVLCSLDTIAWVFDLRGNDIDYNPVFISYAVIAKDSAHLFVDGNKITKEVEDHLRDLVEVHPYEDVAVFLGEMSGKEIRFWIDPKTTNKWLMLQLEGNARIHKKRSPITDLKSVKNDVELKGFKDCLVTDGVAMVKFLKWLEGEVLKDRVTEISAADRLEEFRKQGEGFVGLSFSTISGYAAHGAIIHYDPTPESDVPLKDEGFYLVDSGGQYINGTTDITRTVALGEPTGEMKEMYTRVLKGHIDLAMLRFPVGFSGKQIELPARKSLWDVGKNYSHGTGHGIGHHLNVHEGPMGITPRDIGVPLKAGNVLSNEPGYYKSGEYGIRIENLIVVHKEEELSSEELEFLRFETITLCPIDLSPVKKEIMTEEEISWLNSYHEEVYEKISPHLDGEHKEWLKGKTRSI